MSPIWLPLLKISIDRDGRVRRPNHALDTDEEWWESALSDPRLRSKDTDGRQDRLDRHRSEELVISCSKCPRSARRKIDDLIVEFGPACPCYQAAARIVDEAGTCRFGRDCGLTYETTNNYRRPGR
jgi:hypothetical protein